MQAQHLVYQPSWVLTLGQTRSAAPGSSHMGSLRLSPQSSPYLGACCMAVSHSLIRGLPFTGADFLLSQFNNKIERNPLYVYDPLSLLSRLGERPRCL